MTQLGLMVRWLIRRGLPAAWPEAAMAGTVVMAMFASCMICLRTNSLAGTYDPFAFSLILLAGNIVNPLRVLPAIVRTLIGRALAAAFMFVHPHFPPEARMFALSSLAATGFSTVLACFRIERETRQAYLLALREELRTQQIQALEDAVEGPVKQCAPIRRQLLALGLTQGHQRRIPPTLIRASSVTSYAMTSPEGWRWSAFGASDAARGWGLQWRGRIAAGRRKPACSVQLAWGHCARS